LLRAALGWGSHRSPLAARRPDTGALRISLTPGEQHCYANGGSRKQGRAVFTATTDTGRMGRRRGRIGVVDLSPRWISSTMACEGVGLRIRYFCVES
jgi:hypothetical protein